MPLTAADQCAEMPEKPRMAFSPRRLAFWLPLLGIIPLALWLRTRELDTISLWFDESCSWRISQFPLSEMFDAISRDAHPPFYYVILRGWTSLFGDSPVALRSLSVIAGLGTVVAAVWMAGNVMLYRQAGEAEQPVNKAAFYTASWLAGLLITLNVLHIEMSMEARPYTLGTLMALLSGGFLLKAMDQPNRVRYWVGYTLTALLLSGLHYYAALTVFTQLLFAGAVFVHSWWREGIKGRTLAIGAGLLGVAWGLQCFWVYWWPTFSFQRERANRQLWMRPLDGELFTLTCGQVLSGGKRIPLDEEWTLPITAAWGMIGILLLIQKKPGARLLGLGALVPVLIVVTYAFWQRNILGIRYLIFAQTYLLVGVAVLAARVRPLIVRLTLMVGTLAWSIIWCSAYLHNREEIASFPGIRTAVSELQERREADDVIFVSSPFLYVSMLAYLHPDDNVYTRSYGDHTGNILSGPALRNEDYQGVQELLLRKPKHLWIVDGLGLMGYYRITPAPDGYELEYEGRFSERFGHSMTLLLRKFVRKAKHPAEHPGGPQ